MNAAERLYQQTQEALEGASEGGRVRTWWDQVQEEARVLTPAQSIELEIGGAAVRIGEPTMGAWVRALARAGKALEPVGRAAAVLCDPQLRAGMDDTAVAFALATRVISAAAGGDPQEFEARLGGLFGAVDALAGQGDGWSEGLSAEDFTAVVVALVRVIDPGRYKSFFIQALGAAMARAKGPGLGS